MDDIVRVTNVGDEIVTWRFHGQDYLLRPDVPIAVPTGAAKLHLGDWDAHDRENDKARADVRERLNFKYGMLGAPFYSKTPRETVAIADHDAAGKQLVDQETYTPAEMVDGRRMFMHPNLPRVVVEDVDTGARILTVVDDPDEDISTGVAVAQERESTTAAVRAELRSTQERMDRLISALAEKDPKLAAEFATSTAHPDRPDMPAIHTDPADDNESAGLSDPADPTDALDALDVMNDELDLADKDTPKKKPARKRAATRSS